MAFRVLGTVAVIAAVLAGCKSADDDYEPAILPKAYAFEGKLDPKYAGTWQTDDGTSKLVLAKDGGLNIETATRSQSGKNVAKVAGQWLASDGSLAFKYGDAAHGDTVLKYDAKLEGNALTLQQEGGRMKNVYRRK